MRDPSDVGLVDLPRRDRVYTRARSGPSVLRSMRHVLAVPGGLPDGRARRAGRARRSPLHFLSDHRAPWRGTGGAGRAVGVVGLWLRYLPGGLSMEPAGARFVGRCLAAAASV